MARPVPSRMRRAAVVVAFIVGVVATAATSSSYPTIQVTPGQGSFKLDRLHPAAVSRILFKANAEATTGSATYNVSVHLERLVSGAPIDPALVRVIATSSPPLAASSTTPSASPPSGTGASAAPTSASTAPSRPSATPTSAGWQADLTADHSAKLPIDCGVGPCERAFWVLAVLTGDASDALDFWWTVDGTIGWTAGRQPADATAGVSVDPPIALVGPASGLTASTEPETIPFAMDRLAAARVVEVTADAATIRADGGPTAALTIDAKRAGGDATGSADRTSGLQVTVFALDGPLATGSGAGPRASPNARWSAFPTASPAPPAALPPGADPFVGCPAGSACTRHFLVGLALTGGYGSGTIEASGTPVPFEWQLTLRRTDLIKAWSSPSVMTARVVRRLDIAPGQAPVTTHLEGDLTVVRNGPSDFPHVVIQTSSTSADPLARLLPVPAVMTVRVPLPAAWPDPAGTQLSLRVSNWATGYSPALEGLPAQGMVVLQGVPVTSSDSSCQIGSECPYLEIGAGTKGGEAPPQVRYHWLLDVTTYAYTDVPVTATATIVVP